MKILYRIFLFSFFPAFIFYSCKQDDPPVSGKFCWQLIDATGNPLGTVCNKTAAEMSATFSNPCSYYKYDEKFCWLVNDSLFFMNMPEVGIRLTMNCFYQKPTYTAVKVSCDYCKKFFHRLKKTYKLDNSFTYSQITVQQFCGNTAQTLFPGRQIIEKETADSLIVRQFSGDGIQW
ncbi:hypothetical protein [Ferruginibacter sp. HRS2-29]|uniref:hypothetical protein n=1 Tax=Ferruginibacter sp. HRS2-29 TaxID=2487334 RepID=UPI0020CEAEDD|nr:hypothetical protein [Ferruginibacter sp. HRS2-29]MCP9751878.1 hypothetical protein [Ferruginibacter sp. HRS2-29]